MKQYTLIIIVLMVVVMTSNAKEVEIIGTYQSMVVCRDTHHVELVMVEAPGKDKFSGVRHVLEIPEELQSQLRVGMKLRIKGQKKAASTKRMTKAQVRKHMLDHMTKRQGVPLSCAKMGEIISKLKTDKKGGVKAPCGHNHGKMRLTAADDDHEMVEVSIPKHIEVTELEVLEGDRAQ